MPNLIIPDLSEFQGTVAWRTLAPAAPAAIIRAHNGWRADNAFKYNATVGVPLLKWWAAYQYLPASVDPVAARHAFDALVAPYKPNAVVLDLEEGTGDQSPRAKAWLDAGTGPEILYSGLYFMRTHGLTGVAVPKWIAAYGQAEPTDTHELWQFTDKQTFPGIAHPCDASIFHGTITELIALTNPTTATPTPISATAPTLPTVMNPETKEQWTLANALWSIWTYAINADKQATAALAAVQAIQMPAAPAAVIDYDLVAKKVADLLALRLTS